MSKILVVDDTAVDRRLAGGLLKELQHIEVTFAENGRDALDRMAEEHPDLVLTDMQMPEMNGLELVTAIRKQHPAIPVILMTAQGSEAIAVEALQRGASSYVPKSQLNERLTTTVEELISIARADKSYGDLVDCQTQVFFHYDLTNDTDLIDALVDLVQQIAGGMQLTDETGKLRMGVALREALLNALFHGNLQLDNEDLEAASESLLVGKPSIAEERRTESPYCDRKIHVDVTIDRQEARFVVEDEGPGFDYAAALTMMDPSSDGSLERKRGRGFVLMLAFMDEVFFNEEGNRVTMVKQREGFSAPDA